MLSESRHGKYKPVDLASRASASGLREAEASSATARGAARTATVQYDEEVEELRPSLAKKARVTADPGE